MKCRTNNVSTLGEYLNNQAWYNNIMTDLMAVLWWDVAQNSGVQSIYNVGRDKLEETIEGGVPQKEKKNLS